MSLGYRSLSEERPLTKHDFNKNLTNFVNLVDGSSNLARTPWEPRGKLLDSLDFSPMCLNPPSSSSSSVWELLPICLPFIIQQPPSPCSASINLAFIFQQVRMPPKSEKSTNRGVNTAATGCHRLPQGVRLSGFGCLPNPWKSMKINRNQWKSMKINANQWKFNSMPL